jgi:hypothetical protein
MTSLAAAHHSAPAFNADFYTVTATVIPVLFVALAVQGPFLNELRSLADRMKARPSPPGRAARAFSGYVADAPWRVAAFIVLYATSGEILAIIALYQRHNSEYAGSLILTSTIFLVFATAMGPAAALFAPLQAASRDSDSNPEASKQDAD